MKTELEQNKSTPFIEPPAESDYLYPEPENLFEDNPIKLSVLRRLKGQSVLSSTQFTRAQVIELCKLAAVLEKIEIGPFRPLSGRIVITAFFEASTRTRISFESAVLRLDGRVISIPEGNVTGVKKGESLADIGEMFNAYGDLVILRHTKTEAIEQIQHNLRLPLINAGNGSGEHPTQALADWYALLKWKHSLASQTTNPKQRLHLGILGTPGSMRAVKSFLLLSLLFKEKINTITVVSEMADPFGADVEEKIRKAGIKFNVTNDIQSVLPKLDVIYMNSIAFLGDSYKTLDSRYKLDDMSDLKSNAVIMHPFARLNELNTNLDDTAHNLYFSQAHGAVFIREALLMSIFGRLGHLPDQIETIG